jgi:hypothetical protein
VETFYTTRQTTDGSMAHAHCMPDTYGYKRARTQEYIIPVLTAFLQQQWLHKRAKGLCYSVVLVLLSIKAGGIDGYH